jgi:ribonuclease HI
MAEAKNPETLTDLLRALERSGELRSLARECGLSVRELRRRLAIWRRELSNAEMNQDEFLGSAALSAPKVAEKTGKSTSSKADAKANEWPELMAASSLKKNPMPKEGSQVMEVFTDGASRGNPGPASIGMVFRQKDGPDLAEHCETIGKATNNVAEYQAAVTALEHVRRWKVRNVHLHMDSELIVRQLSGTYRVKSPDLRPLFQQVVFLSKDLKEFKVCHVKRALNAQADALANKALDTKK